MPYANQKGKRGENEFCRWLKDKLELDWLPERNYNQADGHSADIVELDCFTIEVKRREQLNLDAWWLQVVIAAREHGGSPVVAFRQNRKPWEFLISASYIGLDLGYIRLKEREFVKHAKRVIDAHSMGVP